MVMSIFLLLVAFVVIWLAGKIAIEAIEKLSSHWAISRFTLSLFVLGAITSLPEMAITINAVALRTPQIALGNLIGSQVFLLFLVIPVLAIASRGLSLKIPIKNVSIAVTLLVALVPMVALLDQEIGLSEVLMMLAAYLVFIALFTRQGNILERIGARMLPNAKATPSWEVLKLLAAVGMLFLATNSAVREIIELAAGLQTPRFLLSMILLPIGTNLPELSLALGSLRAGKKELALGDYLGAITFNSVLIALLALGPGGSIAIGQNISLVVFLYAIGLLIFWWCCFSKEILSIKEGLLLLIVYGLLLAMASWQILGH